MTILLKDNMQHLHAFAAVLNAASCVKSYDVTDGVKYTMHTLVGGAFSHDDMVQAFAVLWKEAHGRIHVPLGSCYYATIKPTIDGRYAALDLIFTSNDERHNTCVNVEHYNVIGGYWYTSQSDLSATGTRAMNSDLMA